MTHPLPGLAAVTGRALLVAAVAVLLVGCGSEGDDSEGSSTRSGSSPASAADGTDLNACTDGTCEVKVTGSAKIPVDREKFELDLLQLTSIEDDKVSFRVEASGTLSARICDSNTNECVDFGSSASSSGDGARTSASGEATGPAGSRMTANGVVVAVLSVADGSATLRLTPA